MTAATNFTAAMQPHPDTISKGAVQGGPYQLYPGNETAEPIWLGLPFNGVPGVTQGAGWAGKGSQGIDTTTGIPYVNTGTAASPTWVKVSAT